MEIRTSGCNVLRRKHHPYKSPESNQKGKIRQTHSEQSITGLDSLRTEKPSRLKETK